MPSCAMDRIQQPAGGLEDRIQDIERQSTALNQIDTKLAELTHYLIGANQPSTAVPDVELI